MLVIQCSRCGQRVKVPPDEVGLWRRPDGCSLFRFPCPECGLEGGGCLQQSDFEVLRTAGVHGVVVPAEAIEDHSGPPLTLDDLIDLHFLLESKGWEKRIVRSGGGGWVQRLAQSSNRRRAAA